MRYRHTQIGYVIITTFFVSVVVLDLAMLLGGTNVVLLPLTILLIIVGGLFAFLTIEVKDGVVRASFGPGLIHKTVRLEEVERCEIVTYPWYYGYGIRLTPRGWLYNVSGNQAVALILKNGRTIQLGTDQPEVLCQVIRHWIQRTPAA